MDCGDHVGEGNQGRKHSINEAENGDNRNGVEEAPQPKKIKLEQEDSTEPEERPPVTYKCYICGDLVQWRGFVACPQKHTICVFCFRRIQVTVKDLNKPLKCPGCPYVFPIVRYMTMDAHALQIARESEKPCNWCGASIPLLVLKYHEDLCPEKEIFCVYRRLGCRWRGPISDRLEHELNCEFNGLKGDEIYEIMGDKEEYFLAKNFELMETALTKQKSVFADIVLEPIPGCSTQRNEVVLQSEPINIERLKAIVKAKYRKDVTSCGLVKCYMRYKLRLERVPTKEVHFYHFMGKSSFSNIALLPKVYKTTFKPDNLESPWHELPLVDDDFAALKNPQRICIRLVVFIDGLKIGT